MSDERQTLDQRNQMTDLERLRHSAAHVLATAILRIWPEAQFAAGPPVENGFYYDVDLPHRISPEDFPKIEEEMKKEIKANHVFEKTIVPRAEAIALAESGRLGGLGERPGNVSKFKIGNLQDIPEGEEISLFRNGDFLDLCAGPHVMRTGNIGAFRLTHVASAYYKGDEKNPQLQRIYGTAFKNKTQLDEYFTMLEEAKKRDHRKLGKEMELFCFDDDVGPGLPLWLPRGTVLIEELEKLAKETEFAAGYDRVRTPALARENMYLTSGHLPYYAESMFPPIILNTDADAQCLLVDGDKTDDEGYRKIASALLPDFSEFIASGPDEAAVLHFVKEQMGALPDNTRGTISLNGVNGTMPTFAVSLGFLVGDANNTRSVNASDISGVKARSGQATSIGNFRFDVNVSGAINSSDISAVKARSGLALP